MPVCTARLPDSIMLRLALSSYRGAVKKNGRKRRVKQLRELCTTTAAMAPNCTRVSDDHWTVDVHSQQALSCRAQPLRAPNSSAFPLLWMLLGSFGQMCMQGRLLLLRMVNPQSQHFLEPRSARAAVRLSAWLRSAGPQYKDTDNNLVVLSTPSSFCLLWQRCQPLPPRPVRVLQWHVHKKVLQNRD